MLFCRHCLTPPPTASSSEFSASTNATSVSGCASRSRSLGSLTRYKWALSPSLAWQSLTFIRICTTLTADLSPALLCRSSTAMTSNDETLDVAFIARAASRVPLDRAAEAVSKLQEAGYYGLSQLQGLTLPDLIRIGVVEGIARTLLHHGKQQFTYALPSLSASA